MKLFGRTKHAPIERLSAHDHNQAPAPLVDIYDPNRKSTLGLDLMSYEQLQEFGDELDVVRQRVLDDLGQPDADYIRRVIRVQKWLEVAGRIGIFLPIFPPLFILGIIALGVSKILENMEIGHNVMHGQYDWMNDPMVDGVKYEWDNVAPAKDWKNGHNYIHHTYTNIHGMDRDIGYGLLRIDKDQPWYFSHRFNLPAAFLLMLFFEWGVMYHGMEIDQYLGGQITKDEFQAKKRRALVKVRRQVFKDYVIYPVLAIALVPFMGWTAPLWVLGANVIANIVRNIWSFLIIFCGHFPAEVSSFDESDAQNETRGQWYLHQLMGSANISGSKLLHLMSGNLSHQIEHHLFPDIPARRYPEVAVDVKRLVEKYDLHYNTGPLPKQLGSVAHQLAIYSKKPSDPYKVGKSPESKALRRARREAKKAATAA